MTITGCCTSVDVERGEVTVVSDIDGERDVYPLFSVKHSAKHDKNSAPALRVQDPVALVLARGSHLYSDHLTASSEYGPTSSGIPIATVRAEEVGASGFGTFGDVIAGDLCAVFSGFPVHTAEVIEEGAMDMSIGDILYFPKGESPTNAKAAKTSVQSGLSATIDGEFYEIWGVVTPIDVKNKLVSMSTELALVKVKRYGRADHVRISATPPSF